MDMLGESTSEIGLYLIKKAFSIFLCRNYNIKSTDYPLDNQCFLVINDKFHYEITLYVED